MDQRIWKDPVQEKSLDQSQTPFWFWNDALQDEEILRQLKLMTSVGVKCAIPHARGCNGDGFIGGYLDEEWFGHIRTVMAYKKEHDEPVWLYDEFDWPSGNCKQTLTKDEALREHFLTFETYEIPAGEPFRAQLKELHKKPLEGLKPDADLSDYVFNIVIENKETHECYDLRNYFLYDIMGPELHFVEQQDATAYVIKVTTELYEQGGGRDLSYIDSHATDEFLKSTYDLYYKNCKEYFGNTIKAVFNDETRMCHAFVWSDEFARVFQERKGYDLTKYLYLLPLDRPEAGRVRCDYLDNIAYMFQTCYFKRIHDWCEEHGVQLFAHLLGEETMVGQARYSGDFMRQMRYLDIPGLDHLGKGIGSLNIKFGTSAAHSYGKELTGVEAFSSCGWDFTFEEYLRMATWFYQQGIKIITNHAFYYSDRGNRANDWPPSQFFQWKGFPMMDRGNLMFRRMYYALTGGYDEADILVYHPMETFWNYFVPDNRYSCAFEKGPFVKNKKAEKMDRDMQLLLNGLTSKNLSFELLHQDALENFEVRDGKIYNRLNGQNFSVLVLPMCEILPLAAARLCEQFLEAGGHICFVDEVPHMGMNAQEDDEVKAITDHLLSSPNCVHLQMAQEETLYTELKRRTPNPVEIISGCSETVNNHPTYPTYLIDPYMHGGEDITGVMVTRYCKDGERRSLFMNYGDKEETIEVKVAHVQNTPTIWDPYTGEIRDAEMIRQDADGCVVKLTLPTVHGIFLVSDQ